MIVSYKKLVRPSGHHYTWIRPHLKHASAPQTRFRKPALERRRRPRLGPRSRAPLPPSALRSPLPSAAASSLGPAPTSHLTTMEDEDKLSKLPDDVLLYILEKANIITVTRASFLSTRWRHLPTCLSHVRLDYRDFIHSGSTPLTQIVIDETMSAMAKAARICLAAPEREDTMMKTVTLRLWLNSSYLRDIGELVSKAIGNNNLPSVELFLLTEKKLLDAVDMFRYKKKLICFFDTVPNIFRCLTKLVLQNIRFDDESEMHRFLNSCQQLQHLLLNNCDTGHGSVLKIDMPNSKLTFLGLHTCKFGKVELVCLPKLEELYCVDWSSLSAPFSFGYVPCLVRVILVCAATRYQPGFYVSDLLDGTTAVHSLTLDFHGEKIWMLPEDKNKLSTSFNKLTEMYIRGIQVELGLSWTISLLEAAPSLKIFRIEVCNHDRDVDAKRRRVYSERTNPWEQKDKLKGLHLQLTWFAFGGFMTIKKHMQFIRAVIGYAPNLETILLKDRGRCKSCNAVNNNRARSSTDSFFPKSEFEQDIIRNRLGVGDSRSLQIIFE